MANIISRLKLESGEFDSKIKRAGQELLAYSEHCKKMGLQMGYANRDAKEFAKALGSMQTVSQTARGKINELSEAFVNAKVMYKNMTDEEKKGEFGKNLAKSLDQLKGRLDAAKKDLADVQKELNGGGSKFGEFGNVIDTLGSKLGVTGNLTEMLTSKTALLTGAVGASVAIIGKATEAWAGYNAELAKQDQVTQVTTGLKGDDADRMTDKMRALSDTYNVDFREAVNAANTLMTQFGKTGDEATHLIKDGMQGMIQGDGPKLLQMIQQYAPAFRDAGISASQLVAIIHNSEGGIFTDQNMNAIVMGIKNIRLMTKATSQALAKMGIDGKKMSEQLSNGTLTIFDALKQVAGAIQNVDSNSQSAGEVMQQVFGRQGVTAGTNLGKAIETLNTNLDETKRQTGEVGQSLADLQTANEKLNKAIRDCFEYDGWDKMANGIRANLITALAAVVEKLADIKAALGGLPLPSQIKDSQSAGQKDMNERLGNLKNSEVKQIQNRVNMAYYGQQIGQRQFKVNSLTGDDAITKGLRKKAEADLQAWKNLRDEYAKKAKEILNAIPTVSNKQIKPTTETTDTNKSRTTGSNKTLKPEKDDMVEIVGLIGEANERVSDLQKRMRESWDQNEIATLRKQLKEAQNDLDVLQGKLPKDSKVEMTITADDTDALQKVKDIEDVTFDEKTMTVTANTQEALQKVQELVADIDGKVVNMKVVPVITDEDIDKQLQRQYGKAIQVPITPKLTAGEELVQSIRVKLAEDNINADMQTLRTLLETQIKNGIEGIDIPTDMLMQAIIGEGLNIPDKYWKNLQEQINEKLKEMGLDQLDIDFKTGESNKKDKKEKSPIESSKQLVGGLSQVASGLKAVGVELPKEVDQVLGVINGVSQIISGVGTIISIFGTTAITSNTTAVGLNTAAIGGLIAALEFNSATNFFGFANGGIVPHAANGYFVGGNSFSGDNTPIMANAGELVLSKSQQGVLASMLTDGDREGVGGSSSLPYVDGETIYLGLNNYLMRSGRGEIVTTRR